MREREYRIERETNELKRKVTRWEYEEERKLRRKHRKESEERERDEIRKKVRIEEEEREKVGQDITRKRNRRWK